LHLIFALLMNFPFRFLALLAVFSLLSGRMVHAQERTSQKHDHTVFDNIERDFLQGELTLDQKVLYEFYAANKPSQLPRQYQLEEDQVIKCGTPPISDYQNNKSKLSPATIREVESMMNDKSIQASETHTSPSGNFSVHYETTGPHAVPSDDNNSNGIPDYVEEVAAAADSSYRHQVHTLGYTDPVLTGQTYDVYLINTIDVYGASYYGVTTISGGTTYIEIENDFAEGFPPNDDPKGDQIGAVKVTMAHEFKHAIQYGANNWQGETGQWLEMDATLMEEITYDNVNDYYTYLESDQSIFSDPTRSFYPGSYYHASWALYFEEQYGSQFWVNVWNIIQNNPNITMVDAITQQLGGPQAFNEAYIESQLWHYASGPSNTSPNYGFSESEAYPTPSISMTDGLYNKNFKIPRTESEITPTNFAAKYYNVSTPNNTEGDIRVEVSSQNENQGVGLIAYYADGTVETSVIPLAPNESSFKVPNHNWKNIEQLGLITTNSSTSSAGGNKIFVDVGSSEMDNSLSQNYPNPFNPTTRIRFTLEQSSDVQLRVYNSSGRLVRTLIDGEERSAGLHEPTFNGRGLASGVYFYQLITDSQNIVKKMTLVK